MEDEAARRERCGEPAPLRRSDVLEVAAAVRALPTPCASIEVGEAEEIVEDEARPIHQLPRYEVAWQAPTRAEAKALAKELSVVFGHAPTKAAGGRAAPRGKAGKGRRHGGYGI